MVIRNAILDLNGPLSVAAEKRQACYLHGLSGSYSHITNPESGIGVICKTTSVCTNSSTMFAAVWMLSSETMAVATLDAASQTGAPSMV
ncbi:hypothetical protein TNCV_1072801 [Trichonephila clavipes]|nr:hypothetical protein TNCV_1072801 [Trichonephila clavipes]